MNYKPLPGMDSKMTEESNTTVSISDIPPHEIYAGFGIRALARIINMIVGLIIIFPAVIIMVIILMILGAEGNPESWQPTNSILRFLIVLPCGFLYESVSQYLGGADIGKIICRLRVVNTEDNKISFYQAAIRNFAVIIDGLFFGLIALASMNGSIKNQRNGDKWAKTYVIKRKYLNKEVKWGLGKILLGNILGIIIWIGPMVLFDVNQIMNR